jgi:hypothetical protein
VIIKEYHQHINVLEPIDYFQNWYSDVWNRRVPTPTISVPELREILIEESKKVGALIEYSRSSKIKMAFINDTDYAVFVLRWS